MNTKVEIIEAILELNVGATIFFNESEGGGAEVVRRECGFGLFEIQSYGGPAQHAGDYDRADIEEMVDAALSWT